MIDTNANYCSSPQETPHDSLISTQPSKVVIGYVATKYLLPRDSIENVLRKKGELLGLRESIGTIFGYGVALLGLVVSLKMSSFTTGSRLWDFFIYDGSIALILCTGIFLAKKCKLWFGYRNELSVESLTDALAEKAEKLVVPETYKMENSTLLTNPNENH